jgi:transposase InsO family protein
LRDRNRICGYEFRKQLEVMDIQEFLSSPRSPWQRAYAERVIGSIRRECLDHDIVFNEECLRRRLLSYFRYYQGVRLHLSLEKDSPGPRSVQPVGEIVAIPQVGGLYPLYERHAA